MKRLLLSFMVLWMLPIISQAQYANKKVRSIHQAYTDSLKAVQYDYILPIWGQEAYSKGFDIPYPVGMMANYMWMKQGITIDNFELGLTTDSTDVPLTAVDFIQFGENTNTSYTVNVRPDFWLFPFLNVYGIFGYGRSSTTVNLVSPISLTSTVEQDIQTAGFGLMGAFGVGPVWISVDGNFTWNKPELLDEAVRVNVMGIRFGHTFTFEQKPESNFAIWAGGMRAKMESVTSGQIRLDEAIGQDVWDQKDAKVDEYWDWYNSLNPITDFAKIKVADEVLTPIVDRLDAADGNSIVKYRMDKQVKQKWNVILGAQYQLNKKWMLRSEGGIIGDRKQFLVSLNYRFLI